MSCPILRNEPYGAENLDKQLDEQVAIWISDLNRGLQIDRENNTVSISSIFKWYGEDWISKYQVDQDFSGSKKEKAVLNFISNYVNTEDAEYLQKENY